MTYHRTDIKYDDGAHVHACEGDRIVPSDPGTFLVWTVCGKDVPADRGFTGGKAVDCPTCNAAREDDAL